MHRDAAHAQLAVGDTGVVNAAVSPDYAVAETAGLYDDELIAFQDAVFALHLANEAVFGEGSTHLEDKRPLLVFDRGLMDGKAYLRPADFQRMIDSHDLTEDEILSRYGLILHLESAAVGKPELYSSETNDARYEERGTADVVEQNTLAVWDGHPNRRVIPCYDDFDVKCERVLAEVLAYVESQRD